MQAQIGYTLYRLARREEDWATAEELLPELVLPPTLLHAPETETDIVPIALQEARVLRPLASFGLLEVKTGRPLELARYLPAPLLRDFISIEI